MYNLAPILIPVFAAVVYCKASPHISKLQDVPLGIVNGTDAEEGEFPYMVQLFKAGRFSCGGALIGEKWILTAGHCTELKLDTVVHGTNNLHGVGPTNNEVRVKEIHRHPKFFYNLTIIGSMPLYDIAIIELEESIPFNNKTQPLKLAESDDVPFHVQGMLTGWGSNSTYGSDQQILQKIPLQLLNSSECASIIDSRAGFDAFNDTHNLCSDDHFNGECFGDSGSPFVINGLGYGVVSWSIKPCGSNPGTYSRLTNPEYRSFIKKVAGV